MEKNVYYLDILKKEKQYVMENLLNFLRMKNIKGVFALLFKFLVGIS